MGPREFPSLREYECSAPVYSYRNARVYIVQSCPASCQSTNSLQALQKSDQGLSLDVEQYSNGIQFDVAVLTCQDRVQGAEFILICVQMTRLSAAQMLIDNLRSQVAREIVTSRANILILNSC